MLHLDPAVDIIVPKIFSKVGIFVTIMKKNHNNPYGFTLIEVLVAATIIAVLTAVAIVSYSSVNKRSRDAKRIADLEQLRSALEFYRSDSATSTYPNVNATWGNVSALGTGVTYLVPTYMDSIPVGTTNPYGYVQTNSGTGYCLAAKLDNAPASTVTCSVGLSGAYSTYNYVIKNP